MDKNSYNIFGKLKENLTDFETGGFYIVGKPTAGEEYSKEKGKKGGYYYSQKDVLESVDLAINSKFKEGIYDGKNKKTFKNVVNFYKDVALNNINVNVHNYIMEPTLDEYVWPVFFMDRRFKEWAVDEDYDDTIDALAEDFIGKGTCVTKIIGDCVERIPLRALKNSQGAKSLKDAGKNGGYVIIEHQMTLAEVEDKYKDWNTEGMEYEKSYTVFEKYGIVPLGFLKERNGQKATKEDWKKYTLAIQVLCPEVKPADKKSKDTGLIMFLEEIDEVPLEEAHYEKIDGRWLGRGEIEKQLENQIAINFNANLRRRSLLWATKRLFTSTDDEVVNNLALEVQDGAVLKVRGNGQLTPINMQSQHLAEFTADEQGWIQNAQQKAFAFESATGESMPSGTPFRLGVILEKSVSKYFKRKQDTFSNYLKRSFFNQIIEIFKKDNKDEHTLVYSLGYERFEQVKDAFKIVKTNEYLLKKWLKKDFISREEAEAKIEQDLIKSPYLFVKIPELMYDKPMMFMRLNINEPIASEIESLTSFYQLFANKNDPRADTVLRKIAMKQGNNLDYILGSSKPQVMEPQNVPTKPTGTPPTA